MADACQICFKTIKEEAPSHSLCYDSTLHSKLSPFSIKAELSIDENPLACNECKLKIDEEHQMLMQNENILENINLPQSFLTNTSSLVDDKNYLEKIKDEFVEVTIQNENEDIVKEECVLFNTDISECVEELTASDMFKPFKCNICGYGSKRSGDLKNHMYNHYGEKPFSCDMCDYRCYKKSHLIRHNKTHTSEKPFKCNVCNFCCSQAENLRRHMNKHTGKMFFSCDKCDYKSSQKCALIRHNRRHTQEKPFKCIVCDYCSRESGTLRKHMRIHSGERPFSCYKCDYRCSQKSNLIQHNKTHRKKTI